MFEIDIKAGTLLFVKHKMYRQNLLLIPIMNWIGGELQQIPNAKIIFFIPLFVFSSILLKNCN